MKINKLLIIAAVFILFPTALHSLAVDGLRLSFQSTNVWLSWPGTEGETYVVQYRHTLSEADTRQTLAPSLPANTETKFTFFKQIERFVLLNKRFWKPNPDVGVVPTVRSNPQPQPQYVGGHQMTKVSEVYSNACMNALYPLFSEFAAKLEVPIQLPITWEQCTNIECWTDKGQPIVQILLTNGDRFLFEHGYVSLFYAHDNYYDGGLSQASKEEKQNALYQSEPPSKDEMIQLARQAVRKLGYSEKELHMEAAPDMVTIPQNTKSNFFTRYEIGWNAFRYSPSLQGFNVDVEVDAKTKTIKSLQLNNTNLWREPPKIGVEPNSREPAKKRAELRAN